MDKTLDASLEKGKQVAKGVSQEMAEVRLDTLQGDITKLGSAWSGLQIGIGDIFNPIARKGVQALTVAISGLSDLMKQFPKISKGVAYAIGALGAMKVARTIGKIGLTVAKLPGAWLKLVVRQQRQTRLWVRPQLPRKHGRAL